MRNLLLPALLLLLSFDSAKSQIAFSREYGGTLNEDGRWVEQMPDSGFIMTGGTVSYSSFGQTDIWLVRTDAYGNVLWSKVLGSAGFDFANMVKPVPGGFVICGVTNRNGHDDAILIKTDLNGNTIWEKVLGGNGVQWFEAVYPTSDGGYACVGVNTGTGTNGWYDIYLVKFDAAGNTSWIKNIGGQDYEIGNSVQQTADGGYILSGQTYSYGAMDGDYYLVKTNSNGVVEWQQTYARTHLQECHYAQITPDGGYILVGDADTLPNGLGNTDIWVIRTDSLGDILWEEVYGGSKKDGGKTIENTSDGGFIIAGITRSFGLINPNYYIIKTDGSGALEWQLTNYGTAHHDHGYRAIETSDQGFAMFGYYKNSSNNMNFSLVKLGPNGGVTKDLAVDEILTPAPTLCRSNNVGFSVLLTNYGATNEHNIVVTLEIKDSISTTYLTETYTGSLQPSASAVLNFTQTHNFHRDGTHTLRAYTPHRNSDISYTNDSTELIVTVLPPTNPPATTSAIRCSNGSLTLSSSPASSVDSMFWFDAPVNGNLVSSGNSYVTPSLSSSETYYVQSVKGKGSKVGPLNNAIGSGSTSSGNHLKFDSRTNFKIVSVLVYPNSSGNRTIELRNSSGSVLQSKTINLPSAPGGIRVYLNFDVPKENDLQLALTNSSANLFRNSSGAVYPYSVSRVLEIYGSNSSSATTYYYFYDWEVFVPGENCGSSRTPVEAIIGSGSTTAFDGSRCGTGSVALSANSSSSVSWYDAPSGGSLLHSGNTFNTPVISSTTTYYLETSSCPSRIAVDAIVNSQSSQPTASNVSRCGPGTVTLTASSPDPISWYSSASNGVLMHSGSSFQTPFLNATTTYYAIAGTSCPSSPVAVNAIINSAAAPTVTGASACGPASVVLQASSPDPVFWYTAPTGGSPIATTYSYTTPVISNPVTYYVEASTVCPSPRVSVVANVNVTDPPVGTSASRCGAGSVVLSAQSLNPITWWSQASGGTQVGSGQIFTTPSISATTTYYAQASASGCNSQRTAVTATVSITPPPTVNDGARCGPGTVTLSATAADSIFWYSVATGGSPLANGPSFTTPSLTTTTVYYAQAGGSCPSTRVAVNAYISSQSGTPVTTSSSRCGNGTVTLTATSPDPITWYDAPSGGTVVGTGSSFTTPSLSSTTTYYAIAGVTGCLSSPVPATATINSMPADPVVVGKQNCGPAQLTLTATASNNISWYSAPTGGTLLTTGNSYTTTFNSTTTVYVESNDGTCSSNRIPVTATIYSLPFVNLGPPVLVIMTGQTYTLDAGGGFSSYSWSTGATTQSITINSPDVYIVVVTDANGCQGSDTITATLNPGIQDELSALSFSVFPNPTSGKISVVVDNASLKFNMNLVDVTGRIVMLDTHDSYGTYNKEFDLSKFAKGVYYLQLISTDANSVRRIVLH